MDVANAIDSDQSSMCCVEHGRNLHLTTAFKLAAFFGCRIEDLWEPIESNEKGDA